jgi:salicylate hydroxylase
MAVEDGAVLGHLLGLSASHASSFSNSNNDDFITTALRLYESERKSRTTLNVSGAISNRTFYHMHDGVAQEERDAEMRAFEFKDGRSKWVWLDSGYQRDLLGHDAVKSADAAFVRMSEGNAVQQDRASLGGAGLRSVI